MHSKASKPGDAVDVTDVDALIEEGLSVTGILPPYDRLIELDKDLRAAVEGLLLEAQAVADGLNRGTAEWWSRQSAIDYARQALAGDLGPGLRSAAMHVAELAHRCGALRGGR